MPVTPSERRQFMAELRAQEAREMDRDPNDCPDPDPPNSGGSSQLRRHHMSCIDQLRRIRETASGHCADILDRAIAALEDEQGAGGTRAPETTPRPRERHTRPESSISDDERQWTE